MAKCVCLFNFIVILTLSLCRPALSQASSCDRLTEVQYEVHGNVSLVEDQVEDLILDARVAVVPINNDVIELRVRWLQLSDPKNEVHKNPEGWERPTHFVLQNTSLVMGAEDGDTNSSLTLKRSILGMLPPTALQATNSTTVSLIQDTLNLMAEGDRKIVLKNEHKNIVLVLGNTGAGKSTFTQWIMKSSSLRAEEIFEGEYIVKDTLNKIGDSTINSKTTFPELFLDEETNTAYYDFPGFSDTRNSNVDIAASYFIKRTIDYANAVKIIFVVSYPSVRKEVDRQDILTLLKHATELIKDMNKFQNSISLVVTKVDNNFVMRRGVPVLTDDNKIIDGIAHFLFEAKQDLKQRVTENLHQKYFYTSAVKFLETLLIKSGDNYTRIRIFRRPMQEGLLNDMDLIEEERKEIKTMIQNTLVYTGKSYEDFGRTVSEKSKNDVNNLIQEIDKIMIRITCNMGESLLNHYKNLSVIINNKITSFDTNNLPAAEINLLNINILYSNITMGYKIIEDLTQGIKQMDETKNVFEIIYTSVSKLHVNISQDIMTNIITLGRYLKFLQDVSSSASFSRISPLAWASLFQDTLTYLSVSKMHFEVCVKRLTQQFENKILQEINTVGEKLIEYYSKQENKIGDLKQFVNDLKHEFGNMDKINQITNNAEYTQHVINLTNNINISVADGIQSYIVRNVTYFGQLKSVVDDILEFLGNSDLWYTFLINLYDELSIYRIQSDTSMLKDLIDKTNFLDISALFNDVSFKRALLVCFQDKYENIILSHYLNNIKLDKYKIQNLIDLFNIMLQNAEHSCESNSLILKGNCVKLSDVTNITCPEPIETIIIFAAEKVFIDTILNKDREGIQLMILAPVWDIQGKPVIILNGLPGRDNDPEKAYDGSYPGGHGTDGKSGLPGGPGQDFFGVGKQFNNAENLTIISNGGRGGSGQDGGNGANGRDGYVPKINDPEEYLENVPHNKSCFLFFYCSYELHYHRQGCTNGGNGGRAGQGGVGGRPGHIDIISFDNKNIKTKIVQFRGPFGFDGNPGQSGYAG